MSVAWGKPRVPLCATCGSPNPNLRRQCDVCRALCVPDPTRLLSEACPSCSAPKWSWTPDCGTCLPDAHEAAATLAEYREEKARG